MDQWTRFKQSWSKTSGWNKLLVLLTSVIAISNGCYSCYARKQFIVMDGTLAEVKRSGQQSTEQVWHAIDNLNWAARSMDLEQKQAQTASEGTLARMEESNRINRTSLESVQRAVLAFGSFADNRIQEPGRADVHYWTKTAVFRNNGATNAINVTGIAMLGDLRMEPTEDQFKSHYSEFSTMSIPPQGLTNLPVTPEHLPEAAIFGMDLGKTVTVDMTVKAPVNHNFYVWGWEYYRDVFPNTKPHVTEFCRHITGINFRADQPEPHIEFVYSGCRKHNCDDQQCKDYKEIVQMVEKLSD